MWDSSVLVLCVASAAVTQSREPGPALCQAQRPLCPSTMRGLGDSVALISGRPMSVSTHLAQLIFFWLLSEPLPNTEYHPLWLLLYAFVLLISKLGKYGSKQQIHTKPKSLEFTDRLVGDPAALTLSQPAVLTAGYFVLGNENSCSIFSLRGETVTMD